MAVSSQSPIVGSPPQRAKERRRETRHFICFGRPLQMRWLQENTLLGTLIEVSRNGFPMSYQYRRFSVGQEVKVSFPHGEVSAKVVWNRVGKKHVQTGFSVIHGSGQEVLCPQ
jgi:hypothetical protein